MKIVPTWQAQIFCGLRKRYEVCSPCQSIEMVYSICRRYVHQVSKWCVTVTPTKFFYTGGDEDGVIVGVIQYPRFSAPHELLKERTIELAEMLRIELGQFRVSVVFPDETIMLSASSVEELIKELNRPMDTTELANLVRECNRLKKIVYDHRESMSNKDFIIISGALHAENDRTGGSDVVETPDDIRRILKVKIEKIEGQIKQLVNNEELT